MASENPGGLEQLLAENRHRLKQMVSIRLDARVQARVDASDVVQEAFVEAAQRYEDYLSSPTCPEFVWLRFITLQKVSRFNSLDISFDKKLPPALPRDGHLAEPSSRTRASSSPAGGANEILH